MTGESLRDRLRGRARPSLVYELPVGDVVAATRTLRQAEEAHRIVQLRSDEDAEEAVAAARAALEQAQAQLAACYERIELVALPPADFEALVALHPARPDSEDVSWNADSFPKACFLACAPQELSAAEWDEVLAENLSLAERGELYMVAVAVNVRLVNAALPKG
jgi:hypothetical protein